MQCKLGGLQLILNTYMQRPISLPETGVFGLAFARIRTQQEGALNAFAALGSEG